MLRTLVALSFAASILSNCGNSSTVRQDTISTTPASSSIFREAQKAVDACAQLPNEKAMYAKFRALGYFKDNAENSSLQVPTSNGSHVVLKSAFRHDTGQIIVQANSRYCHVGLRNMTPQQSYNLAQPLVKKFNAKTNAEHGNGLSDQVVQAWRVQNVGPPTVTIGAYKTWPSNTGKWPETPGAAVTLYVAQ
ncbi:hypothetical protein [Shimia sp.]|uniref:hypothetical protein n=1 Tax=Shimia sp. TaxID=1954381 RepID=UPI003B8AC789